MDPDEVAESKAELLGIPERDLDGEDVREGEKVNSEEVEGERNALTLIKIVGL